MVEKIEQYHSLAEIIILDNGSTYPPLIEWYKKIPHKVIFEKNLGHSGPWNPSINKEIKTDFYVVTDPDLDLEDVPLDCLIHMKNILAKYPQAGKIGFGLDIKCVPEESPYFQHVNTYEKRFWEMPSIDNLVRPAPVDTTFAIYNKKIMNSYQICGGRTDYPYVTKHIPWMLVELPEEFVFYLKNANESSSYKPFLRSLNSELLKGID